MVSSIQTFGSSANWHPHVHSLVSDGLFEQGGVFHPVDTWPTEAIVQHFRMQVLRRLVNAGWLSEAFEDRLLSWEHSGFSAYAGEPISAQEPKALERAGRYVARAPVAMNRQFTQADGSVKYLTPPDPHTGLSHRRFDPLDWIDALVGYGAAAKFSRYVTI